MNNLTNTDEREILFQTEAKKIGNTHWKLVVYKALNFDKEQADKLALRLNTKPDNGIYSSYYYYAEGDYFRSHWRDMTRHDNYNMNDGTYSGLPKTLVKIYNENENIVNKYLNDEVINSSSLSLLDFAS